MYSLTLDVNRVRDAVHSPGAAFTIFRSDHALYSLPIAPIRTNWQWIAIKKNGDARHFAVFFLKASPRSHLWAFSTHIPWGQKKKKRNICHNIIHQTCNLRMSICRCKANEGELGWKKTCCPQQFFLRSHPKASAFFFSLWTSPSRYTEQRDREEGVMQLFVNTKRYDHVVVLVFSLSLFLLSLSHSPDTDYKEVSGCLLRISDRGQTATTAAMAYLSLSLSMDVFIVRQRWKVCYVVVVYVWCCVCVMLCSKLYVFLLFLLVPWPDTFSPCFPLCSCLSLCVSVIFFSPRHYPFPRFIVWFGPNLGAPTPRTTPIHTQKRIMTKDTAEHFARNVKGKRSLRDKREVPSQEKKVWWNRLKHNRLIRV